MPEDKWVYLTNGNVAPLKNVESVEEIKDYSSDVSIPLSSVGWGAGKVSVITMASSTNVLPGMLIQAEATVFSSTQKASLPVGTRVHSVASSTSIIIDPPFTSANVVSGGVGAAIPDPESYVESGYYRDPADTTVDASTGTTIPPRQLRYRENLWKFTCTNGVQYFRKSQVIGWGNAEPQF